MAESTASLRAEIKALSGVDIMLNETTFKSTYQIMDELSQKWEDLSDISQATIIELMAGKHQGNIFASLMANFDTARKALETSMNSSGSAMKEHAKWSESLEARLNKLAASWQAFAQTFMNSDALKVGIDLLSGLVDVLEKLVDSFGLLGTIGLGVAGKNIFSYFKGAKEAKATLNDVVDAIRETSNVSKEASNVSVAADQAEAVASEQAANAEFVEAEANTASITTELAEAEANTASVATETMETNANVISTTAEMAEAEANATSTTTELAESEANIASTTSEMAEATANAESATAELAEAEANVVSTASEAAESTANLTSATTEAAEGAITAAGGFKAFATSTAGIVAGIGLAVAAITFIINAYKNYREEQSRIRQENIETADTFLDSATSFEKAYIKYSGKTDLTIEEEKELESVINGTVEALDDKSSKLQGVVNSSNDYIASLERIKDAELEAAHSAATSKKNNALLELRNATMLGTVSMVDVKAGSDSYTGGLGDEWNAAQKTVAQIAKGMESKFLANVSGDRLSGFSYEFELSHNANADEIIDYYYTLVEFKDKLDEAAQSNPKILESNSYSQVTSAIEKMSNAVSVYESGVFDAAKAQYQLTNGIPKTTEEYLKMREAILRNDDIKGLSLDAKNTIANALDSEYQQIFDLSSAEVQAKKFIGLIKGYGNGTIDGSDEIGTVETFLNMRTAVNNNECSVGEYLAQFDEIDKMTKKWSDEEKELLNTSLNLDADTIKAQYDEMRKYLYRKVPVEVDERTEKDIGRFLESLTAEELAAVVDIRTEIDWENTSAENIRKQIADQVKLNEALNFDASIEVDKTSLEALNTALEESASAMGLSEESIDSLKAKYSDLDNYDPSTLFEATANGVKLNREELAKLEEKYNDLTKTEVEEHLDTLVDAYNDVTAEIDDCTNAGKRAELFAKREIYKDQIEELATYQAQLEGVTGAYQRWLSAQETPEDYEGYELVATSREDIEDEIGRGFISNATKEYIDLLSGEDLVGGTIDDYANAWAKLDEKVGNTSYSIHDFFTVNDDGDITATGIDRFFKGIQQDFKGSVAKFNEETKKWEYDFSQENLEKIQDEWGIGIEAIGLLLEAAASAGYDVDWGGILDNLDLDTSGFETLVEYAESAQKELNKLEGYEDLKFNFTTDNITDATTEIDKARKAFSNFINKDGTVNLKAEGAEQMQVILTTLLVQKQQLSTPAIMKVDTSQIDSAKTDVIEVINAAQTLQKAYENYEIAISTGVDVDKAKDELNTAIEGMKGTSVDVRADLKLPTDEDLTNAADSIGKIKVGATLDGTSIGAITTKIQTECTPEVIAKVTGLDESAIQDGSQKVVYTAEHSDVDAFIDSLTDISKKIIYTYATEGTKPNPSDINRSIIYKYKTEGEIPEVNGTANANGTANSGRAFARGNWGIKGSGTALVGELGMETLVRGGRFYTIGDNGAEFIKYKQGDIIFNHKQTEELFKNGKVTSDGGRGRMYANGSAYAEGTALWEATASNSSFASNRLNKKSTKKATTETEISTQDNTVKTTTTTTIPSANVGETDFSKEHSANTENLSKTDKTFEETFDWISIAIERIEREIDNLDKTVNNTYKSWGDRNTALASEITKVGEEIAIQNNAAQKYLQKANSIEGLSDNYIAKIQNGTLNLEDFEGESDEALVEKIKEYQKWYELYLQCIDAAEDLKQIEAELYEQRFENVQVQYDGILQGFEHTESMLNEYIAQAEAKGHIVSKNYYQALIDNERNNIAELQKEQADLIAKRDEAVASGAIVEGSKAWYDMCAEIDGVTQAIEAGGTALIEYDNAMRDIDWQVFDLIQERISDITAEANFLIDLMSYDKLFDDNGKLTDKGMATMGLHGQNYNTYMYQADDYGAKVKEIDDKIASGELDGNSQDVINRRRELVELQRESILAAEDEKQAIKDLVEEGINLELEALQERIDLHNEELESMKDIYDYQKNVQEQTENIASLQKQLRAYEGFNDEETRATVQKLKVELESAQQDLQETEYDKYIADQSALLDELYLEYETILNERLDNLDALITELFVSINEQADTINTTISGVAEDVGVELSEELSNIWSGENGIQGVVTTYGEGFKTQLTSIKTTLDGIKSAVTTIANASNTEANTKVTANKTSTSAKKDPTSSSGSSSSKPSSSSSSSGNKSTGDGKAKIGDKVKFLSGKYYYDSQGVNPAGSKNHGKYVYITNVNNKKWATHPIHISTGKKLGSGDLGWLKKNQISGYATGKKNFLDDEIAWTQENGQEFIVRPSDGAILTPIAKGDSVLTSAASNNIWDMANSPTEFIKDNLNLGATNVPNNSNVQNSYVQNFENITFSMPNVHGYNELLREMQKDPKFEKLILSMTVDQIAGKSSLTKGKSIR